MLSFNQIKQHGAHYKRFFLVFRQFANYVANNRYIIHDSQGYQGYQGYQYEWNEVEQQGSDYLQILWLADTLYKSSWL